MNKFLGDDFLKKISKKVSIFTTRFFTSHELITQQLLYQVEMMLIIFNN